jgi:hypothetical protein
LNIQDHFGYLGVSLSNDICDSFSIPSKQWDVTNDVYRLSFL